MNPLLTHLHSNLRTNHFLSLLKILTILFLFPFFLSFVALSAIDLRLDSINQSSLIDTGNSSQSNLSRNAQNLQNSDSNVPLSTSKLNHNVSFNIQAALIPVLVILSGIFAGLTLGYMSLDSTQLIVLSKSGTIEQQQLAKKIAPLRKDGHLLLISLLMANMIANEALPVVSENVMGGGIPAIIVSTVLVIIFSEIIPQSVCATHGLKIGAACVTPVKCLVYLFYPIAWPISRLLNKVLGEHSGIIYRRAELKELVNLHGRHGEHGGDLAEDVVTIVRGALDLQERVVADSMKPLESCFMLDIETSLDFKTLNLILESGHSRIPVYELVQTEHGSRRKIVGALLTKQLILIDPEDGLPLRGFPLNPLPTVSSDMPLLSILNCFQEGRSHLAIVCPPRPPPPFSQIPIRSSASSSNEPPSSFSTTPEDHDLTLKKKPKPWNRWLKKDAIVGQSHHSPDVRNIDDENNVHQSHRASDEENNIRKSEGSETKSAIAGMISMAVSTASVPSINSLIDNQHPVGIISLEDVLEELLGEPIYDETDQDGSGRIAVRPFLPPEAIEALKAGNALSSLGVNEKLKFVDANRPVTSKQSPRYPSQERVNFNGPDFQTADQKIQGHIGSEKIEKDEQTQTDDVIVVAPESPGYYTREIEFSEPIREDRLYHK